MTNAWVIAGDRWAVLPNGRRLTAVEFFADGMVARSRGKALFIPREAPAALHLHALPPPVEPVASPPPRRPFRRKPATDPEAEREAAERAHIRSLALGEAAAGSHDGPLSPRARELLRRLAARDLLPIDLRITLHAAGVPGPFRISRNDFDYSSLGELRLAHSLDNFLILAEELLAYFPRAAHREAAVRFLRDLEVDSILLADEETAARVDYQLMMTLGGGGPIGPAGSPAEAIP